MNRYKYSVIIPHYNITDLLQRCLDSIPKRSDLQVIIVDDNSDTNSVDFSNFPGLGKENTEVFFTKEGRGAGFARNVGLKKAVGEWVLFADSDDYFDIYELDRLLDKDFHEYDAVAWPCSKIQDGQKTLYGDYGSSDDCSTEIMFQMKEPWRKMVRRSVIEANNIVFQETAVSNDIMFSMRVASKCKKLYWNESVIYNWVNRKDSLSSKYYGKKLYTALDESISVNSFLKCIGKSKYYDRTNFYMSILWEESHLKYWFYLLKIIYKLDYKYAVIVNDYASRFHGIPVSVGRQILDYAAVKMGGYKNKLLGFFR